MRALRYTLALLPLVAVWLYALVESSAQFRSLLGGVEASVDPVARVSPEVEVIADAPPQREQLASPAEAPAPVDTGAAFDPSSARPRELHRDRAEVAVAEPSGNRIDGVPVDALSELHPEVTDPNLRRLLAPAWAD